MNIEEAIKVVRNIKFLGCEECVFDNDTRCIKENGEDCQEEAIETLLTAYEKEKEKEKNKELENSDLTTVYLNGVYDGEKKINDKIKAKIEELNKDFKEYENGQEWEIQDEIRGQIDVLQSLLEKE